MTMPLQFGFKVDGETGKITFSGGPNLSDTLKDQVNQREKLDTPSETRDDGVRDVSKKKRTITWTAQGTISVGAQIDDSRPFSDWVLELSATGTLSVERLFDITPIVTRLPYVGPALTFGEKYLDLEVYAVVTFGIGGTLSNKFSTRYPNLTSDSTAPPSPSHNWDVFGGDPGLTFPLPSLDAVYWKAGLGLEVRVLGGTGRGRGTIQLGAPNDQIVPLGGVKLIPNSETFWPPVKRVIGAVSIVLDVGLTAYGLSISKSWQWDLKRFDLELNTDPYFELTKSNEKTTVLTPKTAPQPVFVGTTSTSAVVTSFYPAGVVTRAVGGNALIYSGTSPTTGGMPLYVATWNGSSFGAPQKIAEVDKPVLSSAVLALPEGGFLAVWSERTDDFDQVVAPTRIRWSKGSADGMQWSEPATAYTFTTTALGLQLAGAGDRVFLALLLNGEGAHSDVQSVRLGVFHNDVWSAETSEWNPPESIKQLSMVGNASTTSPLVALAIWRADGTIRIWSYAQGQWGSGLIAAEAVAGGFDLSFDPNGALWLVTGEQGGGLGVLRRPASSQKPSTEGGFVALIALEDATPAEVRIHLFPGESEPVLLVSWIERGEKSEIWAAYIESSGALRKAPFSVTPANTSALSRLVLMPLEGAKLPARVLALSDEDGTSTLKQWGLDLDSVAPNGDDPGSDVSDGNDLDGPDGSAPVDGGTNGSLGGSKGCSCRLDSGGNAPSPLVSFLLLVLLISLPRLCSWYLLRCTR